MLVWNLVVIGSMLIGHSWNIAVFWMGRWFVSRCEYGEHNKRHAAEHHACTHAVEAYIIAAGKIFEESGQRRYGNRTDRLEHPNQTIARANSFRAKHVGQEYGHQ